MKSKAGYLFQIFFVLVMLFAPMGGVRYAQAGANLASQPDAIIITHDLSFWNAIYIGFVNDTTYEKWQFEFTESHNFVVSATPIATTLVPMLLLLDADGNELARSPGTLTSAQPAGDYSIQVQPQSGSGFYVLTLRE